MHWGPRSSGPHGGNDPLRAAEASISAAGTTSTAAVEVSTGRARTVVVS